MDERWRLTWLVGLNVWFLVALGALTACIWVTVASLRRHPLAAPGRAAVVGVAAGALLGFLIWRGLLGPGASHGAGTAVLTGLATEGPLPLTYLASAASALGLLVILACILSLWAILRSAILAGDDAAAVAAASARLRGAFLLVALTLLIAVVNTTVLWSWAAARAAPPTDSAVRTQALGLPLAYGLALTALLGAVYAPAACVMRWCSVECAREHNPALHGERLEKAMREQGLALSWSDSAKPIIGVLAPLLAALAAGPLQDILKLAVAK